MKNLKRILSLSFLVIILSFVISGCSSDNNVMSPMLGNNNWGNNNVKVSIKTQTNDNNQIVIESAKFLIKDIQFAAGEEEEECPSVAVGPLVAKIVMNGGISNIVIGDLPAGSYDEIRFKIHKPSINEEISDPDFVEGNKTFSVVIKGTFNMIPFVYKSKLSLTKRLVLSDPMVISTSSRFNIIMVIEPNFWFIRDGEFIDPEIESNHHIIDDNIRDSFRFVYVQ